jgi:hypothetical protein
LEYVQVEPAAQVVDPVYPIPPHCPHFATVPPAAAEDVVAAELEVLLDDTEVERVVLGALLVVVGLDEMDEELTTAPPGPATEVVRDPLST